MSARLVAALVAAVVSLALGTALADPPRGTARVPAPSTAPAVAPEGVVNINTASEDELARLPGVGPARAQAIVQLRARVRRFGRADDLRRVRGIGPVVMRRMRPFVALDGPTTLASRPGRAPRAERP